MGHGKDVKPILKEIRRLIEHSELSQRRIEIKAGFSRGYLSQLLAQNLDLKVWHLLAVLDILDHHPGEFFRRLDPTPQLSAMDRFKAASQPISEEIDDVLSCLYDLGVESLSGLRSRLDRCERALANLDTSGSLGSLSEPRKG